MKRKMPASRPAAADQLLRYDWPGNVRELENAMERAVALAPGEPGGAGGPARGSPPGLRPARGSPGPVQRPGGGREGLHPLAVLELNAGNQTHAARQLQIGAATLYRKLKSYGLIGADRGAPQGAKRGSYALPPER